MNENFAHLHVHNEYSQLDGYGTAEQYVTKAKEMGFEYLGLTNHGNVTGCIKFQKECDKQGIKSVIGCELYVVPDLENTKIKPGHMTVLVRNLKGWTELCRLLTMANLEGFHGKPRVSYEMILNSDLSGWIILTGCAGSFLTLPGAVKFFNELTDRARVYLEIMPHLIDVQDRHHELIAKWQNSGIADLVATNDCHYIERSDWKVQEVLLAIQRNAAWEDPKRWRFGFTGLHLRSEQEMLMAFKKQTIKYGVLFESNEIEDAMANTIQIAKECTDFRIPKMKIDLPLMGISETHELETLEDLCVTGMAKLFLDGPIPSEYPERFDKEFQLIKKKKFARYFLLVYEILRWCRENDIMYGPGRGSVGGCLIAYLLGITKLDPISYGLSFARFISEDRIDWPDIDIDFEDHKRTLVRQHVEKTYGVNNVCGISTDMRMKAKNTMWDVGRVFGIPAFEISPVTKAIDEKEHKKNLLKATFEGTKEGQKFFADHKEEARLAMRLEGQLRGFGLHPAAVVISNSDLTQGERGNLRIQKYKDKGKPDVVTSCWDMEDAEFSGLMKLDFLGLSTLSVLAEHKRLTKDDFNFEDLPLDDPKIFREITKGNTAGIFQWGDATARLAQEMKIESFDDMVAVVALARPGPYGSGMTEKYVQRKHGADWKPMNEIYENVTKTTYGLLVYQEQVMQVISRVAGLPEGTADKIRKVIGKKRDPKEFEQYKKQFLEGCAKQQTLSQKEGNEFWDGLLKWASYGFNLSHSVEYAMLAYWTAWCKVNYPAEFVCASLTYAKKDEKQSLINDAIKLGMEIVFPKTDLSDPIRWTVRENKLYVPFIEINNVGEEAAKKLCGQSEGKNDGFFDVKPVLDRKTQLGRIALEIRANQVDFKPDSKMISTYFSFSLPNQEPAPETNTTTIKRNRHNWRK